jgi:hypothetical protein
MSRPKRFIPHPKTLVEVTSRTLHSRFLLRPSPKLNEIFLGILGRAQERYSVGVVAAVCMGSGNKDVHRTPPFRSVVDDLRIRVRGAANPKKAATGAVFFG